MGCTGSESRLTDCPRATHNCGHSEDAGVVCQPHVRLAGSSKYFEGRVEAYKDGTWGTVCDHLWDIKDGDVVCRMLGYDGAFEVYDAAHFGQGEGTVHYNGLKCNGTESRILHCPISPSGSCTHAQDAGVRCKIMRLASSTTRNEGRVELYKGETWGTICNKDFTSLEGLQIARELSRSACLVRWNHPSTFGQGTGAIKIGDLTCEGNSLRESVFDCTYSEDASACTHADDISVRTNVGVQVFGSDWDKRGPAGVYRETTWSRVCANDWDIREAHVMCRELGYPGAVEATKITAEPMYTRIRGGYQCKGNELHLGDCEEGEVPTSCEYDAGVVCQILRLADGPSPHIGRLEIFRSNEFGGVCDHEWDLRDAHVACIQLGFLAGAKATYRASPTQVRSSGYMWITSVYCGGLENNILDCGYTWEACPRETEVWVECIP